MKICNLIVLVMTSCMILSGCARNSAWRTDFNEKNISECNEKCLIEKHDGFEVGFLEFSDKGNLFDDNAKKIILEKLDNYTKINKKNSGVIILTFVHGWRHNAAPDDKNLRSFRKALEKISKVEQKKQVKDRRKVFGLYIGWRGLSLHDGLGLTDYLTFWDRKSVAQEVGKGGVTEIFLELDMMAKRNVKNTLLITGHSFGAAVTLSALNEILLDRMIRMKYESTDNGSKKFITFGDGVVLLNPAIEANQIEQLFGMATEIAKLTEDQKIENPQNEKLITIITTSSDLATKLAFYAGQLLDNIFTSHSEIDRSYLKKKIDERYLDYTAVGHYAPFHTANLIDDVMKDPDSDEIPITNIMEKSDPNNIPTIRVIADPDHSDIIEAPDIKWKYISCCEDPEKCSITNKKETETLCKNKYFPISFIYLNRSFVKDHNDVFDNDKLTAFLAAGATGSMMRKAGRKAQSPKKCKKNEKFHFPSCFNYYMCEFLENTEKDKLPMCKDESIRIIPAQAPTPSPPNRFPKNSRKGPRITTDRTPSL